MAGRTTHHKVCHRCGRTGSHAFRSTADGRFECTTATACRVRARREAGTRQDGRGRLPARRSLTEAGPGVAYVIGEAGAERELMAEAMRAATGMSVIARDGSKATLHALTTRQVKLIAISAASLEAVGFRNEFGLRWHQPRLGSVPVFVFGDLPASTAAAELMPGVIPIRVDGSLAALRTGLRRQIRAVDDEGALVGRPTGPA
jgi:hypothetical protein